ncbi:MAG: DUF308 domain-containing protein [Planctomycetales bacterium]|nr:DUF308 domain-containing protein [Planctomycetales bacterium]
MAQSIARLSDLWWVLAVRAVFALLLGLAAILWPGLTIAILVAIFGAFVLLDGALFGIVGIKSRETDPLWWSRTLQGTLSILIGLIALFAPITTAMAMVMLVAVWSILTGVFQIAVATLLRNRIENGWLMVAGGVAFILFGLVYAFSPKAGIVVMAWIIGGYSILTGIVLMVFGLRWKKIAASY